MKQKLLQLLLYIIGYKYAYRAGRAIYMLSRGDIHNTIDSNGELMIQERVVQGVRKNNAEKIYCFDVGANVGDWSLPLLSFCKKHDYNNFSLYMFEPVPSTLEMLKNNIGNINGVRFEELALSSSVGSTEMYIEGASAGTNSLYSTTDTSRKESINIKTTTTYNYCLDQNIDVIHLMKCDTEGHDAEVIIGALPLLQESRIAVLQFEYNHRWIMSRHYLRDIFDLIEGLNYKLGKVCKNHIKLYSGWHFELDRFFESNYVLIRADVVHWFDIRICHFDKSNALECREGLFEK